MWSFIAGPVNLGEWGSDWRINISNSTNCYLAFHGFARSLPYRIIRCSGSTKENYKEIGSYTIWIDRYKSAEHIKKKKHSYEDETFEIFGPGQECNPFESVQL
jgi:hypothetical protein